MNAVHEEAQTAGLIARDGLCNENTSVKRRSCCDRPAMMGHEGNSTVASTHLKYHKRRKSIGAALLTMSRVFVPDRS